MLPIVGALLAALAARHGWPIPLSLLSMAVVASGSAVIYWSAPLSERRLTEIPEVIVPAEPSPGMAIEIAASADGASLPQATAPVTAIPKAGSTGTRAEALVTGETHEIDLLTNLLAPGAFFARLERELARCRAANHTAILVICDLDAFGQINRSLGLADANRMLRQVADCFRLAVREGDILSRIGGDEFAIFFPGLPPEIAESRVRDLRAAVREASLLALAEGAPQISACMGTSSFPEDGNSVEALLAAADRSLALAKQQRQEAGKKLIPTAVTVTRS
jgi:diguanylate cyclase (GGDEF)-like protein